MDGQRRVRAGVPTGGEFAEAARTDADVTLDEPASRWPALDWPALDWEEHDWALPVGAPMSNTARRRHHGPYRAAIVPEIAHLASVVDPEITAAAEDAANEIARFDAVAGDRMLPFAALLLRSESAASSEIEQLTASAKAIALAELGDERNNSSNASTIVSNVRAMEAAIALSDRLDTDSILAMHAALLERDHPDWVGRWRDQQVWIGGGRFGPHNAMFVPPHHDRVPAAMDDLVRFVHRTDIGAITHVAIAHAQFETIHPFPDGNGRAGRALVHSMLRARGVTRSVTVPISAGLLVDTNAYFDALGSYRNGDVNPIIGQMSDATFTAIGNARQMLTELDTAQDEWRERIVARSDSAVWPLTDLLMSQPAVTSNTVVDRLGVSKPAALDAIGKLEDAGVLRKARGQQRNRAWVAVDVVTALDRFAERAGRRTRYG